MPRRPHEQMPSVSPANAPKIDFLPFGGRFSPKPRNTLREVLKREIKIHRILTPMLYVTQK